MQQDLLVFLRQHSRGLTLRRCLAMGVDGLLWGMTTSACWAYATWILGSQDFRLAFFLGILVTLIRILPRLRHAKANFMETGLFFDLRYGLKERLCSAASPSSSSLQPALQHDAIHILSTLPPQPLGPILPRQTPYLAIPSALFLILYLFATMPRELDASPLHRSPPTPSTVASTHLSPQEVHLLAAQLEQTIEKAEHSQSEGDRERVRSLAMRLEEALHQISSPRHQRGGEGLDHPSSSARIDFSTLRSRVERVLHREGPPSLPPRASPPDWRRWTEVERSIPASRRAAVRAYLEQLEKEMHG